MFERFAPHVRDAETAAACGARSAAWENAVLTGLHLSAQVEIRRLRSESGAPDAFDRKVESERSARAAEMRPSDLSRTGCAAWFNGPNGLRWLDEFLARTLGRGY